MDSDPTPEQIKAMAAAQAAQAALDAAWDANQKAIAALMKANANAAQAVK